MGEYLRFSSRGAFRRWLEENGAASGGVWLLFGKAGGPKTLKAGEALEEALCFGWIDGQMKKLDEVSYIKYFAPRTKNSNWSEKNKKLAQALQQQGRMADCGRAKIEEAVQNGQWSKAPPPAVTEEGVAAIAALLQGHEPAYANFLAMAPSVKKTYARAYFDAKTDAGRAKRFAWMADRLNKNLKPM